MDPQLEFGYRAEVVKCWACAALERARDSYAKQDTAEQYGVLTRLTRTPTTVDERR